MLSVCLHFPLNRILQLRLDGGGVHLNAIALEELNGLKSFLSRASITANPLDNFSMTRCRYPLISWQTLEEMIDVR